MGTICSNSHHWMSAGWDHGRRRQAAGVGQQAALAAFDLVADIPRSRLGRTGVAAGPLREACGEAGEADLLVPVPLQGSPRLSEVQR